MTIEFEPRQANGQRQVNGNGATPSTRVVVSSSKTEGAIKAITDANRASRWPLWQRELKRLDDAGLMTRHTAERLLKVARDTGICADGYARSVDLLLKPFLGATEDDGDVELPRSRSAPSPPAEPKARPVEIEPIVAASASLTTMEKLTRLHMLGYAPDAVGDMSPVDVDRIIEEGIRTPEPRADGVEAVELNGGGHHDVVPAQPAKKPVKSRSALRTDVFDDIGRITDLFKDAMRQAGFHPPSKIVPDGKIHRFSTNGEKRDTAGFYVLFLDNMPAGSFGDFRSGFRQTWSARNDIEIPRERRAELEELSRKAQAEREAEERSRHAKGAIKAKEIWEAAREAPTDHPYLVRKKIKSHGVRVAPHQHWGPDVICLIVPVMDGANMISLHYYPPDEGQKKLYLGGARGKGGYFILGEVKKRLFLATGFATAATVREETGEAVAVMFGDDNIMLVAKALRALYPDVEFIICADDDWKNEGNPAVKKATAAAKAAGSKLVIPSFIKEQRKPKDTDFNDMRNMLGGEKVRERLAAAAFFADPWEGPPELDPTRRAYQKEEREDTDQGPQDNASPDDEALRQKREERRRRIIERAAWDGIKPESFGRYVMEKTGLVYMKRQAGRETPHRSTP